MKNGKIIEKARRLRADGYSFKEISENLGISKSTASIWLRHVELSNKAKERINNLGICGRTKALATNKRKKEIEDAVIIDKVKGHLINAKIDLKIACSLLYWGEGAKHKLNSAVSFTNADPEMISYFLYVFRNSFDLDEKKFRALIHLHEYHNVKKQLKFWSNITKIPINQFYKPYLKKNTGKNKKENYPGCINIRYSDSRIYRELIFTIRKLLKMHMRG